MRRIFEKAVNKAQCHNKRHEKFNILNIFWIKHKVNKNEVIFIKKLDNFPKIIQELVIKYIIWLIICVIRGQVPRSPGAPL